MWTRAWIGAIAIVVLSASLDAASAQNRVPSRDRSSDDATPSPSQPSGPRTPIKGVDKDKDGDETTPVSLCAQGSLKLERHTRPNLTLSAGRYCADDDWVVQKLERAGGTIYWEVPFTDGKVYCSCRAR
jgi:hypothetical protein